MDRVSNKNKAVHVELSEIHTVLTKQANTSDSDKSEILPPIDNDNTMESEKPNSQPNSNTLNFSKV